MFLQEKNWNPFQFEINANHKENHNLMYNNIIVFDKHDNNIWRI